MAIPTRRGDTIRLRVWTIQTVSLVLSGLRLGAGERIPEFFRHEISVASTGSVIASTTLHNVLEEGYLITLEISCSTTGIATGTCYARLEHLSVDSSSSIALAAGYVTNLSPLSFPGSGLKTSLAGPGCIRQLNAAAAASPVSVTFDSSLAIQIVSIACEIITSAVAGNRGIILFSEMTSGAFPHNAFSALALGPGTNRYYYFTPGYSTLGDIPTTQITLLSIPQQEQIPLSSSNGLQIYANIAGAQAGDTVSLEVAYRSWLNV